jgi:hypothetical protein
MPTYLSDNELDYSDSELPHSTTPVTTTTTSGIPNTILPPPSLPSSQCSLIRQLSPSLDSHSTVTHMTPSPSSPLLVGSSPLPSSSHMGKAKSSLPSSAHKQHGAALPLHAHTLMPASSFINYTPNSMTTPQHTLSTMLTPSGQHSQAQSQTLCPA